MVIKCPSVSDGKIFSSERCFSFCHIKVTLEVDGDRTEVLTLDTHFSSKRGTVLPPMQPVPDGLEEVRQSGLFCTAQTALPFKNQ